MSVVVISQPMLFPWVGLLEQVALADVYVHHADIQWSKSGFVHRVQIKTADGIKWLNVPVSRGPMTMTIDELVPAESDWRQRHLRLLRQHYGRAPHGREMIAFVSDIYEQDHASFSAFLQSQLETVSHRLGVAGEVEFTSTRSMALTTAGSERVLDIVRQIGGHTYVTGHGARNYLDHERFESHGVEVLYMDYAKTPYPQQHGEFTPFVSVLDLIAAVGFDDAAGFIAPRTVHWREFCAATSVVAS